MINKKILTILLLLIAILSIGFVVASETIEATTGDTYYFYTPESLASTDGYDAAIVVDGDVYYLDSSDCDKLSDYSPVFKDAMSKQPTASQDIEVSIDKPLTFTYTNGTVGLNKEAHIVDTLTLDE